MNYNTQLPQIIIPEYGRNVQSMIEHCITLENREERNRCAKTIVNVMGQLNPHLRDAPDYAHKLWDHLFVISGFRLDVDSPYPKPSAETFKTKPQVVHYPQAKIKYRYYGKIIEEIITKARDFKEGEEKDFLKRIVATQLKKSYLNWNKDTVQDDVIFQHLLELSGGELKMDDSQKLIDSNNLMKRNTGTNAITSLGSSNPKKQHHNNKNKHHKKFKRK